MTIAALKARGAALEMHQKDHKTVSASDIIGFRERKNAISRQIQRLKSSAILDADYGTGEYSVMRKVRNSAKTLKKTQLAQLRAFAPKHDLINRVLRWRLARSRGKKSGLLSDAELERFSGPGKFLPNIRTAIAATKVSPPIIAAKSHRHYKDAVAEMTGGFLKAFTEYDLRHHMLTHTMNQAATRHVKTAEFHYAYPKRMPKNYTPPGPWEPRPTLNEANSRTYMELHVGHKGMVPSDPSVAEYAAGGWIDRVRSSQFKKHRDGKAGKGATPNFLRNINAAIQNRLQEHAKKHASDLADLPPATPIAVVRKAMTPKATGQFQIQFVPAGKSVQPRAGVKPKPTWQQVIDRVLRGSSPEPEPAKGSSPEPKPAKPKQKRKPTKRKPTKRKRTEENYTPAEWGEDYNPDDEESGFETDDSAAYETGTDTGADSDDM